MFLPLPVYLLPPPLLLDLPLPLLRPLPLPLLLDLRPYPLHVHLLLQLLPRHLLTSLCVGSAAGVRGFELAEDLIVGALDLNEALVVTAVLVGVGVVLLGETTEGVLDLTR